MHLFDAVGKMHKSLAAGMVLPARSQNVPAGTAVAAVATSAAVVAAVPGRSIAVAGQVAAVVVVAPGRPIAVARQTAADDVVAEVVAARWPIFSVIEMPTRCL